MAFALATGQHISSLKASNEVESHGYGKVQRSQGHPGWLLIADQMSPIGRSPDPRSPWQVVCDGYLANHDEIAASLPEARELRKEKHPNELIAALLDQSGPDALFRLVGNFAIVAANKKDGSVVAMRDRMGGRTLYRLDNNSPDLLIASRSAWVQILSKRPFQPDPKFLASFFAMQTAPPPGHSSFEAVAEALPGQQVRLRNNQLELVRRPLNLAPDFDYKHPGDCIVRFRELLEKAVAATLPPTGNVACMLSGGLDSAPAAIIADRLLASRNANVIPTSWRLDRFPEACEAKWISMAASKLRSAPIFFDASDMLPFSKLGTWALDPDAPHYNGFREPVLRCYELAADAGCKITLNGNAGDELYAPPHLLNIDRTKRRQWKPIWRDLKTMLLRQGLSGILRYPAFRHPIGRLVAPWSRPGNKPPLWLADEGRKHWQPSQAWPPECQETTFPAYTCQLLGARMAYGRAHECAFPNRYGVDRRDPFHNEALAKFMLHAPFSLSHRQGETKWIMRQAAKQALPSMLARKGRTGVLTEFWDFGRKANKKAIHSCLGHWSAEWRQWVRQETFLNIVDQETHMAPAALLSHCVGYSIWSNYWAER